MPSRLDKAAELVGEAIGTVEAASTVAGARARQGLSEARAVIEASESARRIEKRAGPIARKTAKKVKSIKKTTKRKATNSKKKAAKRKAAGAKTTAKKRSAARRR